MSDREFLACLQEKSCAPPCSRTTHTPHARTHAPSHRFLSTLQPHNTHHTRAPTPHPTGSSSPCEYGAFKHAQGSDGGGGGGHPRCHHASGRRLELVRDSVLGERAHQGLRDWARESAPKLRLHGRGRGRCVGVCVCVCRARRPTGTPAVVVWCSDSKPRARTFPTAARRVVTSRHTGPMHRRPVRRLDRVPRRSRHTREPAPTPCPLPLAPLQLSAD